MCIQAYSNVSRFKTLPLAVKWCGINPDISKSVGDKTRHKSKEQNRNIMGRKHSHIKWVTYRKKKNL